MLTGEGFLFGIEKIRKLQIGIFSPRKTQGLQPLRPDSELLPSFVSAILPV